MPDQNRRPLTTRNTAWAQWVAGCALKAGLRPNVVSLLSIVSAILAGWAFIRGSETSIGKYYLLAAIGIQLRLLCNMLDGMIAVEGGLKSRTGELYNEFPDRIADTIILVAAGYGTSEISDNNLIGWIAAVAALLTAYVRALGAATGARQHFVGPMAKPHRMFALTLASIAAALSPLDIMRDRILFFVLLLIILGCIITMWRRLCLISKDLNAK